MKTTQIRGSIYGIGIIDHSADLERIIEALTSENVEVDEDSTLTNVYVSSENVGEAVKIINALGYETDEDEE